MKFQKILDSVWPRAIDMKTSVIIEDDLNSSLVNCFKEPDLLWFCFTVPVLWGTSSESSSRKWMSPFGYQRRTRGMQLDDKWLIRAQVSSLFHNLLQLSLLPLPRSSLQFLTLQVNTQDLICNYSYCLLNDSHYVSLDNLVLDQ